MSRLTIRLEETVAIALVLSAAVLASSGVSSRKSVPPVPASISPIARAAVNASVFLPVETASGMKLIERRLWIPGSVEPRQATLNCLLDHSKLLPKGARVKSLFLTRDGTLTLDFSRELLRFSAGSTQEALVLAALSSTVARFDGVKAFRLRVAGQPVISLAGHVDLTEPYPAEKTLPEEFR